ncbi:UPF0481 protein At3g47200-like [Populus alba]|uniref:UPF0481 protein At3g47200-like n=1 Tax=Populus alba TaxID=43335 RepID=UPI003CC77D1F
MILWDAVFIFELFLKHRELKEDKKSQGKKDTEEYQEKYKYDYIIAKPWLRAAIRRDLILLENQLPFWILDDLYGIVSKYIITGCSCPPETDKTCCSCLPKTDCCCPCITFPALARTFFKKYNKSNNNTSPEKPLHFTDLVRSFFLPKETSPEKPLHFTDPVRCCLLPKKPSTRIELRATRLDQAGVKFMPKADEYLIKIRSWTEDDSIKKGELHVPTLKIDDHTDCIFRNLMALEQCHYPYEAFIRGYVIFLDCLVDSKEDVDLLIKNEVIVNKLGESDDVAKLINKLCKEITEVSSLYDNTAKGLNDYYESWYNNWKTYLRRQYFKNVWVGTGTVVGFLVVILMMDSYVAFEILLDGQTSRDDKHTSTRRAADNIAQSV